MKTQEFNQEFCNRCKEYNGIKVGENVYEFNTPFGKLNVISSASTKFKTVFMRFTEDFNIEQFFKYFSREESINKHSKKWNIHNTNAEYVLQVLDERLHNLTYIYNRDGKICGKEYEPIF